MVMAMKNEKNGRYGLLERTLLEFKQKGNASMEEIKQYLYEKYQLSVTIAVLRKRFESTGA